MVERCHSENFGGNVACVCPFTPGDPGSEAWARGAAAECASDRDSLAEGARMNGESELAGLSGLPKLVWLRFADSIGLSNPVTLDEYVTKLKEGTNEEVKVVYADLGELVTRLRICELFVKKYLSGTKTGTIDLKLLAIEVESLMNVVREALNNGRMTQPLIAQFNGIYMRLVGLGEDVLPIRSLTNDIKSLTSQLRVLTAPPVRQTFASAAPVIRDVVKEARGLGPYGKIIIVGAGLAAAAVGLYLYFASEE